MTVLSLSACLNNLHEISSRYYMCRNVCSRVKSLKRRHCAPRIWEVGFIHLSVHFKEITCHIITCCLWNDITTLLILKSNKYNSINSFTTATPLLCGWIFKTCVDITMLYWGNFFKIFLVILKHALQNYWEILNKCFLVTDSS